jgi:hypothetical protein
MTTTTLSWDVVPVDKPDDVNVVIGQAHFIKTVEDLHEAMVGVSSSLRFGLAFCEASGPRLIRRTGNDPELVELATRNALAIAAGRLRGIARCRGCGEGRRCGGDRCRGSAGPQQRCEVLQSDLHSVTFSRS